MWNTIPIPDATVISHLPAMRYPTVSPLYQDKGFAVRAAVKKSQIRELIPNLIAAGATDILEKLEEHFKYLFERWESELLEFNGEEDHVHLLTSLNPKVNPSKLVNNLKTVTSRIIRRDFLEHVNKFYKKPVFWSRTYCIITCGGAPLTVLKQYIENQKGV